MSNPARSSKRYLDPIDRVSNELYVSYPPT
jgi:hypothetical protein